MGRSRGRASAAREVREDDVGGVGPRLLETALDRLGDPLGDLAERGRVVLVEECADLVSLDVCLEHRIEQATRIAFGGVVPLHACHLAAKLRVGRVMVPLRVGVLSALGLLVAPPAYDIVRTHKVPLQERDAASTRAVMEEMAESIACSLSPPAPTFSEAPSRPPIGAQAHARNCSRAAPTHPS